MITFDGLDVYDRRARASVLVVVLLPAVLSAAAWAPGAMLALGLGSLAGVASLVVSFLLVQLGRDPGKRAEQGLWATWDGPSTTRLLRHRDRTLGVALKAHYHARLQSFVADVKLPSADEEALNPLAADDVYAACTKFLIAFTKARPAVFPHIHAANIDYGFRRNLWGWKVLGLPVAGLGALASLLRVALAFEADRSIPLAAVASTVLCLFLLLCWAIWVTPTTVKLAADAYAERLLEACDQMGPSPGLGATPSAG